MSGLIMQVWSERNLDGNDSVLELSALTVSELVTAIDA